MAFLDEKSSFTSSEPYAQVLSLGEKQKFIKLQYLMLLFSISYSWHYQSLLSNF